MKNSFFLVICICFWSSVATSQIVLLNEIEDSIIGKINWKNDSIWLNQQLNFEKDKIKSKTIVNYRLVRVDKENFYEGPLDNFELDTFSSQKSHYGDSILIFHGMKFYTYIGNSSWGFFRTYHLLKVTNKVPLKLSGAVLNQLKIRVENTCEHGWDPLRGQACYQCMNEFRLKRDSNSNE